MRMKKENDTELSPKELKLWNLFEAFTVPIMGGIEDMNTCYDNIKAVCIFQGNIKSIVEESRCNKSVIDSLEIIVNSWINLIKDVSEKDASTIKSLKEAIIETLSDRPNELDPLKVEFDITYDLNKSVLIEQRLKREAATNIHVTDN